MTVDSGQAWYVYSILPSNSAAPQIIGVLPGTPVAALPAGTLTVLASLVDRALFDRNSRIQRTEDPDWMAARIAAHHAVNAAATAAGPCLPLSFGVLFSTLERLQEWFAPREARLAAALAQVDWQSEWALSLQQEPQVHAAWLDDHDPALRALAEAAAGAGEGTAFLMARRREKFRVSAGAAHISTVAAGIVLRLAEAGFTVRPEAPRAGRPAWSVLAPADCGTLRGTVASLAEDLADTGLSLRMSGPWPPYAFARTAFAEVAAGG